MLAKEPQVTLLGEHRLLQLGIHIEVILLDFLAVNLVEQCLDLRRVKTCKAQVKAAVLDVLQQIRQEGIGYRRISRMNLSALCALLVRHSILFCKVHYRSGFRLRL